MEYTVRYKNETQAKQLKINVTKINSFLKDSNKKYIGLKKSNNALISRQEKIKNSRINGGKTVREEI